MRYWQTHTIFIIYIGPNSGFVTTSWALGQLRRQTIMCAGYTIVVSLCASGPRAGVCSFPAILPIRRGVNLLIA